MTSEFSPPGGGARMTKAQIKKYIKDMKKKQEEARKKLKEYEDSGELEKDKEELARLEKELEEL